MPPLSRWILSVLLQDNCELRKRENDIELENTLEYMHFSNRTRVIYVFLHGNHEGVYLLLILAIEHKHSAQFFFKDMSYAVPFNTSVNHYHNNHLNKHCYAFISDGKNTIFLR